MRLYTTSIFPAILSAASMSSKRARYSARFESWRSFRKLSRPLLRSLTLRLDSPSYSPSAMSAATTFIETINTEYEKVHKSFELQFWGTKMALGGEAYSVPELTRTKAEMEVVRLRLTHTGAHASHASLMRVGRARVSPPQAFLASKEKLAQTREYLASSDLTDDERKTLKMFERTFGCYIMENPEGLVLREQCMKIEGTLEAARNKMKLGATIDGSFVELSSVGLRNKMRVEPVEGARQG